MEAFLKSIGIYTLYEKWLWRQISNGNMPRHVGIILDGNRRWARKRGMDPWIGHKYGASNIEEFIRWCYNIGIEVLTLYVLSLDNFKRGKKEIDEILNILVDKTRKAKRSEEVVNGKIRFKMIGRREMLSDNILKEIEELEAMTEENDGITVNIALAYGGKGEIVDAAKKIVTDVLKEDLSPGDLDENLFQSYLYTSHLDNPNVDMIIRTSGEMRLSDFLLWQSAYSELVFLDVYWPSFRKIDLMRAIRTYQMKQRRFGK